MAYLCAIGTVTDARFRTRPSDGRGFARRVLAELLHIDPEDGERVSELLRNFVSAALGCSVNFYGAVRKFRLSKFLSISLMPL